MWNEIHSEGLGKRKGLKVVRVFTGEKVNLDSVRFILCDYDDTACVHIHIDTARPTQKEWENLSSEDKADTYINIVPCKPNPALAWFLNKYFHETEKQILTWAYSYRLIEARKRFVDLHYPNEFSEIVVLKSREEKVKYMEALAKSYGFSRDEVLIIEDHPDTLHEAKIAGFQGLTTAEINVMYLDMLNQELNMIY